LLLSTGLFSIGIYGLLTRRHAVALLMSTQLMLAAVIIALVAFARFTYQPAQPLAGQALAVFIIGVAVAEVIVGTALARRVPRQ
jgi:NADH:ubiquinone oxidoreductase subunit K